MSNSVYKAGLLLLFFGINAMGADRVPDPRSYTAPTEMLSEQEMQTLMIAIEGCDLSELSASCKEKVSAFQEDLTRKRNNEKRKRDEAGKKAGKDASRERS